MASSGFDCRPLFSLLLVFLLATLVSAIRVTPNSPCSSVCAGNGNSTTSNSDLSCEDGDFNDTSTGQKWVSCLICLQNSTYSEGDESDQSWFFYNLRYNIAYCVFAYPNASDIGSSPCQTSTACGPLQEAVEDGVPTMGNLSEYDYCNASSNAMTGEFYDKCLSCLSATSSSVVISNALVALEAGCVQEPTVSQEIGLSGSIFGSSVVSITELSTGTSTSDSTSNSHLKTGTIAAIVIVSVLGVLVLAGISLVVYRKRQGRRMHRDNPLPGGGTAHIEPFPNSGGSSGGDAIPSSAVSAGIGSIGWSTPPQSLAGSPYQTSVAMMPAVEVIRPDGTVGKAPLPVFLGDSKDVYAPNCPAPFGNRLDRLSALPQLSTSPQAMLPGGHQTSPESAVSPFTHTPFQYGHADYYHPSSLDSPTSPVSRVPSSSIASPTDHLRLYQVHSALNTTEDAEGHHAKKHLFAMGRRASSTASGSPTSSRPIQTFFPGPPTRK